MGSDAISTPRVHAFSKNFSKTKRGNKMAKLRQNNLNFERGQCLIQVNSKEYTMKTNDIGGTNDPSVPKRIEEHQKRGNLTRTIRRNNQEIPPTHGGNSGRGILHNDIYRYRIRNTSSGSCSSSCSEEDRDKGYLDDWETISDAINDAGKRSESDLVCKSRAWSSDGVFRPQNLPRISRHENSNQIHFSVNDNFWDSTVSSVCPICCEDFDVTDLSFLPCPCGFRVCLFCHKKIIEVDGRCPGCRKRYCSEDACAGDPGASLVSPMR